MIISDNSDGVGSHISEMAYSGSQIDINITPDGDKPLIVTMCWSDPEGTPPLPSLNPRTKMLVNDLDMELKDTTHTAVTYPYYLDPDNPSAAAVQGDNNVDNIEQIYLDTPYNGGYTLYIKHDENGDSFVQNFSLIVSGGKINSNAPPPVPSGHYRVTYDQKLNNQYETSIDTLYFWNNYGELTGSPSAPAYFDTTEGSSFDSRVSASKKLLFNEKFNTWNNNSIKIQEVFHNIRERTIVAKFDSVFNSEITYTLISGNGTPVSGKIYFKDPWYIDENDELYITPPWQPINLGMDAPFEEKSAPFSITVQSSRKGVFLKQGYDSVNNVWTQPYYMVKAQAAQNLSVHGKTIKGYF